MNSTKGIFVAICAAILSSMLGMGIIAPLLPIYAKTLGATELELGIIFAGFSAARIISIPIIGKASDQYGRKTFLSLGMFIYMLMSIGYALSHTIWQLLIVRLVQGFASGMIIPIASAYIGDITPKGKEGKYMGVFNIFFFGGFGAGPIIGGFMSDIMGMNFAFYSMGGLNLIALILAISLLPNAENYNRNIIVRKSYILMLKESNLTKGLFNFRILFAVARSIFSCFLPIFCGLQLGLSGSQIGILLSINMLLSSVLQIFTGRLADIFSRRALIIIGGVGDTICFLLIPLMHSFYQLLGLCMLSAIANAISPPSSAALATEEGRKYGMGASMGMFNMAMSIGMAVGPIIGGAVSSHFDVGIVFIFAAIAEFTGILLFTKFTFR